MEYESYMYREYIKWIMFNQLKELNINKKMKGGEN